MIYQLNDSYFVRALMERDLDGPYTTWFEDQDVCKYNSHGKLFKNREYFRGYLQNLNQSDKIVWAICHIDGQHIGNISLQKISYIDRTAEFAILLGDKCHWGKGIGFLAGKKLMEHGFQKLNMEKIYCGTAATNIGMRKLASALGMTLEGVQRSHLFLEGERVDVALYGVLLHEYKLKL
jgi:ribosomal-protein-alanine N-acetyltransferase